MTTVNVSVKILSPVHIGAGRELRLGFDFVLYNGQTWIFNEDAILEAKAERLIPDKQGHYPLPGALLQEADFKNLALFRYILRGQPRSVKADARMQAFIKDPFDRPYIPGSSLKGALRTALAWTGWKEINMPRLTRRDIGNSRSWAAKPLEGKIFGKDPNHDLLRALQVSDLRGPQNPGEGLAVINAQVLSRKALQSPIELEALIGQVEFHGSITIDDTLFAPWAAKLGFSDRQHWLKELFPRANEHSRARIQQLLKWFETLPPDVPNAKSIADFYYQLLNVQLSPHQAIVQIGWGAGWDGKTYWTHLKQDAQLFEQLVRDFHLDKAGKFSRRKAGDPFPTSRRVAVRGKGNDARPIAPFGWVLITVEPTDGKELFTQPRSQSQQQPSPQQTKPQAAAPAPRPVEPTAPKPKPAEKPLITSFKDIPKPGDRFRGKVFSDYKGEVWLDIPGLNPDEQAYAVLLRSENPLLGKVKEGQSLECEAIAAEEELSGYWRVKCRLG